jgi:hypothetical protein
MPLGRRAVAGVLLALAIAGGPAYAKDNYKMTPEEAKLYQLQLQQEQEAAAKYNATPEGKAEIRRRFEHDAQVQADRDSAEGAEINRRLSPNYRPPAPPEQHMCSVNYGSTVGLAPCP